MGRKKRISKSAQKAIDTLNLNLTLGTDESALVKGFYTLSTLVVVYGEKKDSKYMYKILKELDEVLYDDETSNEDKVSILFSAITYEELEYKSIMETLSEFLTKMPLDSLDKKSKNILTRNVELVVNIAKKLDM